MKIFALNQNENMLKKKSFHDYLRVGTYMWFDWKVHRVNLHAGVQVEVLVPPWQLIVLHADWWVKGSLEKENLVFNDFSEEYKMEIWPSKTSENPEGGKEENGKILFILFIL